MSHFSSGLLCYKYLSVCSDVSQNGYIYLCLYIINIIATSYCTFCTLIVKEKKGEQRNFKQHNGTSTRTKLRNNAYRQSICRMTIYAFQCSEYNCIEYTYIENGIKGLNVTNADNQTFYIRLEDELYLYLHRFQVYPMCLAYTNSFCQIKYRVAPRFITSSGLSFQSQNIRFVLHSFPIIFGFISHKTSCIPIVIYFISIIYQIGYLVFLFFIHIFIPCVIFK